MQIVTILTAISGAIFGTAGLVLGIVNYLRDNPKIVVHLQWDMRTLDDPRRDSRKLWGIVRVANIGRRPIFVSHSSLELPKGYKHTHLLLMEGIQGTKLAEGDPPMTAATIDQDGMEEYGKDWRKIRVVIYDSAGRAYRSATPAKPPSWAEKSSM